MASKSGHTDMQSSARKRQLAGLKPFPPGVSGNPGGKLKDAVMITPLVRRHLAEHPEDAAAIVAAWVARSKLEHQSLEQLLERTEGKVADQLKLSGTIQITVVYEDAPGSGAGLDAEQREHQVKQ